MSFETFTNFFAQVQEYVFGETDDESSPTGKVLSEDSLGNQNPADEVAHTEEVKSSEATDEDFSPEFLTRLIENSLDKETKIVNATKFLAACELVPQLFNGLGSALKKGNGKLLEKVKIVRGRQQEAAKELGVEADALSLQDIIERDIKNGVTHSGKKARQATRNIIRLVWFLDFISMLFDLISTKPDATLRSIIQECWANTLGPRNLWLVNKATTQALKVAPVPPKQDFFVLLGLAGKSHEEMEPIFQTWVDRVDIVSKEMWAWLISRDLESVP
mmetsp:Transcript_8201/g.9403  ORF Transcript_8201/g.9403 Transcript_8201/m.9403 type:complete len:275 (+) Transcript_8201:217-1041(+)